LFRTCATLGDIDPPVWFSIQNRPAFFEGRSAQVRDQNPNLLHAGAIRSVDQELIARLAGKAARIDIPDFWCMKEIRYRQIAGALVGFSRQLPVRAVNVGSGFGSLEIGNCIGEVVLALEFSSRKDVSLPGCVSDQNAPVGAVHKDEAANFAGDTSRRWIWNNACHSLAFLSLVNLRANFVPIFRRKRAGGALMTRSSPAGERIISG
jgi:hypothetical protein